MIVRVALAAIMGLFYALVWFAAYTVMGWTPTTSVLTAAVSVGIAFAFGHYSGSGVDRP